MNEQLDKYFAPVRELNALAIANLEKLVDLQVKYFEDSARAGVEQLKTAAAISDAEGLKSFFNSQLAVSGQLSERAVEDSRTIAELGNNYVSEAQKVVKETMKAE